MSDPTKPLHPMAQEAINAFKQHAATGMPESVFWFPMSEKAQKGKPHVMSKSTKGSKSGSRRGSRSGIKKRPT